MNKYKQYTIYFFEEKSFHQRLDPETLKEIFPLIDTSSSLKLISSEEYNKLKEKGIKEIVYDNTIYNDANGFIYQRPFLKTHFKMNSSYDSLLTKYDFENGIFVHIRYGDKIFINYKSLVTKKGIFFTILNADYYSNSINKLRKHNPTAPVYIFTDSKNIAKYMLQDKVENITFVEEGAYQTFYCFTKCHYFIASRSTMSLAAIYLNYNKNVHIIAPDFPEFYVYSTRKYGNIHFKYPPYVLLEKDKSYILKGIKEYKEIIKRMKTA
jgi:hypothetical protein